MTSARPFANALLRSPPNNSKGAALLVVLFLVLATFSTIIVSQLSKANLETQKQKRTLEALAQAKEALVGYSASVQLNPGRPGDLPCPDNHPPGDPQEGNPTTPCNGNSLGRLPWKKLGLPDLRDGSGERLWYAVSINFKNSSRTVCNAPGQVGCLNSDTPGTITVRDSYGEFLNNGTDATAAIAVIIAPGEPLIRQDGIAQSRSAANANAAVNFLDIGNGEDNATFVNKSTDGFINGTVRDADNNVVVNDRILAITASRLMPILEQRVAGEVLKCLTEYASKPQNHYRYPWPAALNPSAPPDFSNDTSGARFGRVADTFSSTKADSGNSMDDSLTGDCNITATSGWWPNWKEHVFYALADVYKPGLSQPSCGGTGTCLSVTPPSAVKDKQIVVFVAGQRLTGVTGAQPRTSDLDKGTIKNYLEAENAQPFGEAFSKKPFNATFNDHVLYK